MTFWYALLLLFVLTCSQFLASYTHLHNWHMQWSYAAIHRREWSLASCLVSAQRGNWPSFKRTVQIFFRYTNLIMDVLLVHCGCHMYVASFGRQVKWSDVIIRINEFVAGLLSEIQCPPWLGSALEGLAPVKIYISALLLLPRSYYYGRALSYSFSSECTSYMEGLIMVEFRFLWFERARGPNLARNFSQCSVALPLSSCYSTRGVHFKVDRFLVTTLFQKIHHDLGVLNLFHPRFCQKGDVPEGGVIKWNGVKTFCQVSLVVPGSHLPDRLEVWHSIRTLPSFSSSAGTEKKESCESQWLALGGMWVPVAKIAKGHKKMSREYCPDPEDDLDKKVI